jgi:two-component system, NarL family, sensor kinase
MPQDIKYYFITSVIAVLLLGLFILLLAALYSRKQQKNKTERLKMQTQFQQALLQTQLEIQEQTLKTISQEIHDNIGQVLSLAKLNLNTLQPGEETKLIDTKNLVSKAINDLRDLSRSLYGNKIAELGLVEAVDNELKILQNSGQFTTSLKIIGNSYKLEPQKEMVVFRIVQECLNNIIKHSKAQNITVMMEFDSVHLRLTVTDDGVGFDTNALPETRPGIGLKSMQTRAALIGGMVSLSSAQNKGTTVTVSITGTVI